MSEQSAPELPPASPDQPMMQLVTSVDAINGKKITMTQTEWNKIFREKLDDKPVIEHPVLGKVVEVRPGVLARQVTMEDAFQQHLVNFEGPRMPTEELERARFNCLVYAKNNNNASLKDALMKVSTEDGMAVALREDRKNIVSITDHMAQEMAKPEAERDNLFRDNSEEAKKVYENMKKAGRVVQLRPGAVVDGKVLSREFVQELRDTGVYNIFVRRPPSEDKYMNEVRQNAANALAFVEGKMHVTSSLGGLDEKSDPKAREEFQVALAASTHAISLFEREKNLITRRDGEEITVRVNLDLFYKSLDEDHTPYKHIKEFMIQNGDAIGTSIAMSSPKSNELLVFIETMECALFMPRLAQLLCDQPLPRVVEFSRLYNIYRAAAGVMTVLNPLKTKKKAEAVKKRARRELHDMVTEDDGDVTFSSAHVDEVASQAGTWTEAHTTRQDVSEGISELRVLARRILLWEIGNLQDWFVKEEHYHANRDKEHDDFKPQFTHKEIDEIPNLMARFFYRQLWIMAQTYAIRVLHSYEFRLLLELEEYLPRNTKEFWRSPGLLPETFQRRNEKGEMVDVDQCPGITRQLVQQNNRFLVDWRKFNSPDIQRNLKKYMIDIPVVGNIDRLQVDDTQSWSPTIAQMRKYHRDMASLFRLTGRDVQRIVARFHKSEGEKAAAEMEVSLAEYMSTRQESMESSEKDESARPPDWNPELLAEQQR